jgi:hypothetical protein
MTRTKPVQRKRKRAGYDTAWKEVIKVGFEPFMELLFPGIHRDIDFSRDIEFLDKELSQLFPESKTKKRVADILIKVYLQGGSKKSIWILFHIEVQGQKDPQFMIRVFIYHYRIFDRYKDKGIDVVSLAVLADEDPEYRPTEFAVKHWGFEHRLKIPIAKLIDFKLKSHLRKKLETSTNPMAIVVKAVLKSHEAKQATDKEKSSIKWDLIKKCYRKGYTKNQIEMLLKFIDWIIRLPDAYQQELSIKIAKLEEEQKMNLVTSWERLAERKGKRKGKQEGKQEGKIEIAQRMLKDNLPLESIAKYTGLSESDIKNLMKSSANSHSASL